MAFVDIAQMIATAAYETMSVLWMEIAMFAVAGLVFTVFARANAPSSKASKASADGKVGAKAADRKSKQRLDTNSVLHKWEEEKFAKSVCEVELASVVDAMRKNGKSIEEVMKEIEVVLDTNAALQPSVEGLPNALLGDGDAAAACAAAALLERRGKAPDASVYAGLMTALLRRRDFTGVLAIASKVPETTPKMHAILASTGAQRGRLDEALGHIRQLPAQEEGAARGILPPAVAAQVLQLAVKESRVGAAAEELQRLRLRLEWRHFEEIIPAEGRRGNNAAAAVEARRDLLQAATALQVPKCAGFYSAMANVTAHGSNSAQLYDLVQEIETAQAGDVPVDEVLSLALLDACKVLKAGDLVTRILKLHRAACAGAPGAKVLSAACSAYIACDNLAQACDLYEKEMAAKGIWPDASLSAGLLKVASQLGRTALAKRLADHVGSMKSGGSTSDLQRVATMIKAHARERDLTAAKAVFDRLCSSGATLSPLVFNALLDALVHCGDLDGALKHFEEMKRLKFVDVVGYNTMLKGYLGAGRADDARALVQEMADSGLQANKVTYNELLHSKVMSKDRNGLWSVIDQMHIAGVKANSVTCSILLKSLTVQSEFEDVKRVVDLIDEVEEAIDEVLFSSVIEACIRIGQLDLLSDLMRRYKQKGGFVSLAAPTYGSMIKAYGAARNVVRVRELWSEMEERGVKPTAITIGCMTEALVINGQAEEAWTLVHKELESAERQACINTVIYSTVLKGFAVTKNIQKVFTVYDEMKNKGISCNTITYNTMLDACAKCCAMGNAAMLLQDMKAASVEPDIITYSTIIKGYCLEGDVDRAFDVLEEMKRDDKFTPDEIMYNSILDGCAKEHRVDEALKILDEMKAAGVGPSNYTLSILVKLLGHARRLGQAFHLVEDLSKQNGFRPNVQVYTCMVQACVLNRRLDKALQLHDTMVADSGCRVDEKFYAVLAKGCLQMHQPLKAIEVVRAAYKLSGHSLAESARRGPPVGVDARALDEIASKLHAGGWEEQEAIDLLAADLLQYRNVRIGDGKVRSGGGGGGGGGGSRRGKGKGGGKGGGGFY